MRHPVFSIQKAILPVSGHVTRLFQSQSQYVLGKETIYAVISHGSNALCALKTGYLPTKADFGLNSTIAAWDKFDSLRCPRLCSHGRAVNVLPAGMGGVRAVQENRC
jgi:hypothetical protein